MSHDHVELLTILPPLVAYRRDLESLGAEQLTADDGTWITAAVALWHLESGEHLERDRVDRTAALLDIAVHGMDTPQFDSPDHPSPPLLRRARLLAERIEGYSGWHLALSVLAIAERALDPSPLDLGRIRAHRARIQWWCGAVAEAEAGYRELLRFARRANEPELIARGQVGLAAVSHLRGNHPAMVRWAKRTLIVARRASLPALDAVAHHFLMIDAAERGDHAGALAHGWTAFETAHGHPVREAEMLLNLAQLLATMGQNRTALAGFVAALERDPPPRIALPAWGGLATAASALGDRRITQRAAARIDQLAVVPGWQFARASALAEATFALERVHLDASQPRRAAMALAEEYRFNEISYRLAAALEPKVSEGEPAAAAGPVRDRLTGTSTAVITTAVDALVDLRSSRVLA
jgi:tetratricopeptide (TPR) repeat protein